MDNRRTFFSKKRLSKYPSRVQDHNTIKKLKGGDGAVVTGEEGLQALVTDYFFNLFTPVAGTNARQVLENIQARVSPQMNEALAAVFTKDEVKEALDSIGDLKAPGADGMPAVFYKRFWGTVGETVVEEVLNVLRGGEIPEGWNETVVVLIPKVKTPESLKDLRPISLCNVVYKLVSKVLANRLKLILDEIISPNQSAFVPGRLISDNTILAYEMSHFMKRKRSGKQGYMAVKLDMSKAYDRVEWSFLEQVMTKLGFCDQFVANVMKCVRSVSYRFKVNGNITETVVPGRGLRQGDPISPYLFLLCAEGFSALLHEAEAKGHITGIKLAPTAPSVNHLLFADDSLLLLEATAESAAAVNAILQAYEEASGQVINREKSSILFSKNCSRRLKESILLAFGLRAEGQGGKYLGLPTYIGLDRAKAFAYIKEKIWKRIVGWKERFLSKAAREILIKAIAQAIPTYAMACFDLTKGLCDDISQMICRYWWSQQDNENKAHWVSWKNMMKPKEEGGLGFRDIYEFNLAMLARQGWRLIQAPESLCARVLRAKYFADGDMLNASPTPGMSYVWRSILKGIKVLKMGIIWRVGNGTNIRIWEDPWIPDSSTRRPSTLQGSNQVRLVSELLNTHDGTWNCSLVRSVFNPNDAKHILQIPIFGQWDDKMAWHYDSRGMFSVKSAYKVAALAADMDRQAGPALGDRGSLWEQNVWKKVWKLDCPPKVHHFLWRVGHDSLPTRMNIERKHIDLDTRCAICNSFFENGGHLFVSCSEVKKAWRVLSLADVQQSLRSCTSGLHLIDTILKLPPYKMMLSIALIWCWWTERNKANRGERRMNLNELLFSVSAHYLEWHVLLSKKQVPAPKGIVTWEAPPTDWILINTDGAFHAGKDTGGWGALGRDSEGDMVFAMAGAVHHAFDPLHVEAFALLQAAKMASRLGIGRAIFATDCLNLQQALSSSSYDLSKLGAIIAETKFILDNFFIEYAVSYVPRTVNKPAHLLAALGIAGVQNDHKVWYEHVPDVVSRAMYGDLAVQV